MNLEILINKIKEFHKGIGTPYTAKTSVVSPLFPGQFNYCLDEANIFYKYGDLLPTEEEHFQKIQPAIRLSDYESFVKEWKNDEHLGVFSLSTISGFHAFKKIQSEEYYRRSVRNFLLFLAYLGLNTSRVKVSYFSGNNARSIEESRKHDPQEVDRKIKVDVFIPEDALKHVWIEEGLSDSQLEPNNSRDNFLTSAWYITRAPWGYRNEIFYQLEDGYFLDLGTIERMTMYPTVETQKDTEGNEVHYVTKVEPWENELVIDAIGIERLVLVLENKRSVWDTTLFEPFRELRMRIADIERIRILHRIFTDCPKSDFHSRNRKKKAHWMMRDINHLTTEEIKAVLDINTRIYDPLFPDLESGIEKTIMEIESFRRSSTTFKVSS